LLSNWRTSELGPAVGDNLIHVHVELRAATGHPNVQRKHGVELSGKNFVASLDDQTVTLIFEPLASVVRNRGTLL
jgi:hypothetical protein